MYQPLQVIRYLNYTLLMIDQIITSDNRHLTDFYAVICIYAYLRCETQSGMTTRQSHSP